MISLKDKSKVIGSGKTASAATKTKNLIGLPNISFFVMGTFFSLTCGAIENVSNIVVNSILHEKGYNTSFGWDNPFVKISANPGFSSMGF